MQAAWHAKCPRCRKGNIYEGPTYGLKVQKMNSHCPYCGLRFEREPGYFYGAMYVTYAFAIAEMVTACMATYFITGDDSSFVLYATVAILSVVLLSPFNYRYSRIILMYWLTPGLKFDPNIKKKEFMDGKPVLKKQ